MKSVEDIYYIILYYTKLRLNKYFYKINKDFLKEIKKSGNLE